MSRIRVGVVGAGGIGGTHLRAYAAWHDLCEIVAVADVHQLAAQERAAKFGARVHEMAFMRDKAYHVGIAVVVDQKSLPDPTFEMFDHGNPDDERERKWGIVVGVPEFKSLRREVVKWIHDLT